MMTERSYVLTERCLVLTEDCSSVAGLSLGFYIHFWITHLEAQLMCDHAAGTLTELSVSLTEPHMVTEPSSVTDFCSCGDFSYQMSVSSRSVRHCRA